MNLEALLHTYFVQKQQSAFPTLFIKWIFFRVKVTDGNNDSLCMCSHLPSMQPAGTWADERAGPSSPPCLDQSSGSFSAGPYHYSHSSNQVWLKTETSGLNITPTGEKKLSVKLSDSPDLRQKEDQKFRMVYWGSERAEQKTWLRHVLEERYSPV